MSRVILDIETVGIPLDALDPGLRESVLRDASTDDEVEQVREGLGLHPVTGEIVAIGLLNPDTLKGVVYYQAPTCSPTPAPEEAEGLRYEAGTETEILERFWAAVRGFGEVVTFNGRTFDCPFIMIRSAVRRVRPTRNLMPNRFSGSHIDLFDQLTFHGACRRRFGLDAWCRALGITSPKAEGVSGQDVAGLFGAGRYRDIARYCGRDLRATAELLAVWERYVRPGPGGDA